MLGRRYWLGNHEFGTDKLFPLKQPETILIGTSTWLCQPIVRADMNLNLARVTGQDRKTLEIDRNEDPSTMSTFQIRRVERRRTARLSVFADLTVHGVNEQNEKFKVQTRSLSVSGYGGLTVLDMPVSVGQTLFLINDNSRQKAECKVVSLRPGGNGKTIVAFEFVAPVADFWKMTFPPAGTKPQRRSLPTAATA